VRVVASTDANLEALIGQESFRMPLLQRLSGLVIEILPLRKRREDISCILRHFLEQSLQETGQLSKLIHCEADGIYYWAWFFAQCSSFDWPGNVRQLKNIVTQLSVALMGVDDVSKFDWQGFVSGIVEQNTIAQASQREASSFKASAQENLISEQRKPREISDDEILTALEKHQWQIKLAADSLKISRSALYQKIDASESLRRASDIPSTEIKAIYLGCSGNLDNMVDELKISRQALTRRLHEMGLIE
jgi:two-component system nitrogen regulation response regulator GlnG